MSSLSSPRLARIVDDPVMKGKMMADVFDLVVLYDSSEPRAIQENIQRELIKHRESVRLVSTTTSTTTTGSSSSSSSISSSSTTTTTFTTTTPPPPMMRRRYVVV